LASPLFVFLTKDAKCIWTEACQHDFEDLKHTLVTTLFFRGPNCNLPFHIHIDTSDKILGVVLG